MKLNTDQLEKISGCESQELLLELMESGSEETLLHMVVHAGKMEDEKQKKYIMLCLEEAVLRKKKRTHHEDIICAVREMLYRSNLKQEISKITLAECGRLLGLKNPEERKRVIEGKHRLPVNALHDACEIIADSTQRLFWENLLVSIYEYIPSSNNGGSLERQCLNIVAGWTDTFPDGLGTSSRNRFKQLMISLGDKSDAEEKKEGLYDMLERKAKEEGISKTKLYSFLNLEEGKYRRWKKNWEYAEDDWFCYGIPQFRLLRVHLLAAAVHTNMTFDEAVELLARGGYRFRPGEPDQMVAKYLTGAQNSLGRAQVIDRLDEILFTI